MQRCPRCKDRVWTFKRKSPRLCAECEETTRYQVEQKLARVNEQWRLYRKARDRASALAHLEDALRHAKPLTMYRKFGYRACVPSPVMIVELLERTRSRVAATVGMLKPWEERSSGVVHVLPARGSHRPEAPAPKPSDGFSPRTTEERPFFQFGACFDFESSGEQPACDRDRSYAFERFDGREAQNGLNNQANGVETDAPALFAAPQNADRRKQRRVAPAGVFAHILEKGESAPVNDFSTGGLSVTTRFPQAAGTRLNLVIGASGQRLEARGIVRWVRAFEEPECAAGGTMGLEFLELRRSPLQGLPC